MKEQISKIDATELTLNDKLVYINRVAKVVKGGKRLSFSALVVTGDGAGHVGIGVGKSNEVPTAIAKASAAARKGLIEIPLVAGNGTIPHEIKVKFGAAEVFLKPAGPGTGVIAGGSVRSVLEAAGVRDILTKSMGSNNRANVAKATLIALSQLRNPRIEVARRKAVAGAAGEEKISGG